MIDKNILLEAEKNGMVKADEFLDLYRELNMVKAALKVALDKLDEYGDTDESDSDSDEDEDETNDKSDNDSDESEKVTERIYRSLRQKGILKL